MSETERNDQAARLHAAIEQAALELPMPEEPANFSVVLEEGSRDA